jgi:reactive intermediate/imine deaminase
MLRRYRFAALTFALLISVAASGAERAKPEFMTSDDPARRDLPFSDAVRAGDLMFLSGQIGLDSATGKPVAGGIKAEARQALTQIKEILTRHGASLSDVVKCTVFLGDIAYWPTFNVIYGVFFKKPFRARRALAANGRGRNARVEVECIAYVPKK